MIRNLRSTGLDIVIVFDSTGSMTGEIDEVKVQIERIGKILMKLVPDTRISLCTYRDEGDEYEAKGIPLTNDLQELKSFLDTVFADAGGDLEEAVHKGMSWAVKENQFRTRARKVMLIFGDAPPHDEYLRECLARHPATFAGVIAEGAAGRLTLSGGVAVAGDNVGGRAGLQFSW